MASDHIRASDHDRDAVVATLRDAFSEGRLSLEEFQERTTATYAARTWGDLKELTTDLPVQPLLGADLPPEARPAASPGQVPGARAALEGQHPLAPPSVPGAPPTGWQQPRPPQAGGALPPSQQGRGRPFGPVLPIVGMWMLFALATRSAGGAIFFLVAVVLLAALTTIGRRPPRGPSGGPPR